MFLIMPNKMARTLAALFACVAWVFTVRFLLRPGAGEQLFFDGDRAVQFPRVRRLVRAHRLAARPGRRSSRCLWWLVRSREPLDGEQLRGLRAAGARGRAARRCRSRRSGRSRSRSWRGASTRSGCASVSWALFPLLSIALAMFAAFQAYPRAQLRVARLRDFRGARAPVAVLLPVRHDAAVEVRDHDRRGRGCCWRRACWLGRRAREAA